MASSSSPAGFKPTIPLFLCVVPTNVNFSFFLIGTAKLMSLAVKVAGESVHEVAAPFVVGFEPFVASSFRFFVDGSEVLVGCESCCLRWSSRTYSEMSLKRVACSGLAGVPED